MTVRGIGWMRVRTIADTEMVRLYRDVLRLEVVQAAPGATWFRTADGTEIHVGIDDRVGAATPRRPQRRNRPGPDGPGLGPWGER